VCSQIIAVMIVEDRWSDHGVIERGVEIAEVLLVFRLDNNLPQLLVPFFRCLFHYSFKVPMRNLGADILHCVMCVDGRYPNLHENLLIRSRLELRDAFLITSFAP